MPYGYHGKILHAYLTAGELQVETPDEGFYRKYMGGSAMGTYYLLNNTPPNTDPLAPENTFVLALSAITGAPISGQSRITAAALSPLTGGAGDSQAGGFFPAEMKFSGFDALVVHGKAGAPVYLWLHEGEAELRSAEHLWGKDTAEVEDILKTELDDPKIEVLQTGIAGENLVRYAALINMANRANGRNGLGAVMGSKNLKAVVVRGRLRPPLADPKSLKRLAKWGADTFPDSGVYGLHLYGTSGGVVSQDKSGGLPTRNWQSGTFEGAEQIGGVRMAQEFLKGTDTCYACTIKCKRVVEIDTGPYQVDPRFGGPEYESLASLGSYCGVDSLEAACLANQLCNQYGLDSISCGATIAWAMDCYEQGLITKQDTGGIELTFGSAGAMLQMIELIAKREGFGDLLAEGSARAAEELGRGTEDYVVTVKSQELPAHMPRVKPGLGLIYAVNPFGADHESSDHDPSWNKHSAERLSSLGIEGEPQPVENLNQEKVHFLLTTQYWFSMQDSLNVCNFVFGPSWPLYKPEDLVKAVEAITGWDVSIEELLTVGRRRVNLMRAVNSRQGFTDTEDDLPKKLFQPLVGGKSDGKAYDREKFEEVKHIYYRLAGWDDQGKPTTATLDALGLEWLSKMLEQV
jgi:aldehyde:ferredoxin oxidoreductase